MDERSDATLVALARDGDGEAFAVLYGRYFDGVYDFVARMLRDRDEAADIAQDTFLKAMGAIGSLKEGERFKSWLFSIARNTALNRVERAGRTRPLAFTGEDGETVEMDVVDPDRFSSPEEAAGAAAIAGLVWEAAAGLDPKYISLLHMHLREGLESAEIADALGITRNNGYVMLNRMKKAVEEAIGAFIMMKEGRRYCGELDAALAGAQVAEMTPAVRRLVGKHVNACPTCEERRRKLVSPLAVFGAFAPLGAPPALKAQVLEAIRQQWPNSASGSGSGGGGSDGGAGAGLAGGGGGGVPVAGAAVLAGAAGGDGGGGQASDDRRRGGWLARALGGGAVLVAIIAALVVPFSPFALTGTDDAGVFPFDGVDAGDDNEDNGTGGGPTASADEGNGDDSNDDNNGTATGTADAQPTSPANAPPGDDETPLASGGSPSPTVPGVVPTATSTSTATTSATPSDTATATPTPTNTATATPTPTRTATPTSTPCVPAIDTNVDSLSINASSPRSQFDVFDGNFCDDVQMTVAVISGGGPNGWISVDPTALTLSDGQVRTIAVAVSPENLPGTGEGVFNGVIRVVAAGGNAAEVAVVVTQNGNPPEFEAMDINCNASGQVSFDVAVSDDFGVAEVLVRYGNNLTAALAYQGGMTWRIDIAWPRSETGYTLRAVDGSGKDVVVSNDNYGCSP